jgi:hypothetical protein
VEIDYFVANTDSRPAKNVGGSMVSKVVIKSFTVHVPRSGRSARRRRAGCWKSSSRSGESVECQYEIKAPAQVNLSCEYNRIAYAYWTALYRRGAQAHYGHQVAKIGLGSAVERSVRTEE